MTCEFPEGCTCGATELNALKADNDKLRTALKRARTWGVSSRGFDGWACLELTDWIDEGMGGPLPPLPIVLEDRET